MWERKIYRSFAPSIFFSYIFLSNRKTSGAKPEFACSIRTQGAPSPSRPSRSFCLHELHRPHISVPVQRRDHFISGFQFAVTENLFLPSRAFFVLIAEAVVRF